MPEFRIGVCNKLSLGSVVNSRALMQSCSASISFGGSSDAGFTGREHFRVMWGLDNTEFQSEQCTAVADSLS